MMDLEQNHTVAETHTLEMTPMDSTNAAASLPTPDEYAVVHHTSGNKSPKRGRKKLYLALAAALVAVMVIVGVSVGVTSSKKKKDRSSTSSSSSNNSGVEGTTNAPVENKNAVSMTQVVDWLARRGVSSRSALLAANTPQNAAAQWLAHDDPGLTALPADDNNSMDDYLLISKYVASVLYYSTNGPEWTTNVKFLSSTNVCEWNDLSLGYSGRQGQLELGGLICDDETDPPVPIILDVELNELKGPLPTELGLLTTLQLIDMEYNEVTGTLPTELCALTDLKHLWFRVNNMTGTIPDCYGSSFPDLWSLNLQDNTLTGNIPDTLCELTSLQSIVLDRCGLDGEIPACVGEAWTDMKILSIADNALTGEIPTELALLTTLQELYLDGNDLEGNPLDTINGLLEIDLLYLEENQFTGDIDAGTFQDLLKVRAMDLSENQFTLASNTFPTQLLTLPQLTILDLSINKFAGSIPNTIAAQDTLVFWSLHENAMTGAVPASLTNLNGLQHLDMANNDLDGTIPQVVWDQPQLLHIFLSENPGFTPGPLPNLQNATQLREISLKNTQRTGPLPELVGFTNLFILDLDDNQLTGPIPSNYGQLPNLRHLILNSNSGLTGDLPAFTTTSNLGTVLLDKTSVTGDFTSICDLPTFTGAKEIATEVIMIADCSDDDSGITCACCHCCFRDQDVCSNPVVASLDWTWEYGFQRAARDFAINATRLERPTLDVATQ